MHTCSSTKAKCPDSYCFGVATKTFTTFCFSAGVGGPAGGFAAGSTTGCTGTAAGFAVLADVVVVVDSFAASLCGQGGTLQIIGIGTAFCASAMRREAAASSGSGKADHFGRVAFFAKYFTGLNLSQFSVHGCIGGHTSASCLRNSAIIVEHCSTNSARVSTLHFCASTSQYG